jgi:hypothetical protein
MKMAACLSLVLFNLPVFSLIYCNDIRLCVDSVRAAVYLLPHPRLYLAAVL